jgi:hypothetical protein
MQKPSAYIIHDSVGDIANVGPSLPILVALMMEAIYSSETSVLRRAPRRNISVDGTLDTDQVTLETKSTVARLISFRY